MLGNHCVDLLSMMLASVSCLTLVTHCLYGTSQTCDTSESQQVFLCLLGGGVRERYQPHTGENSVPLYFPNLQAQVPWLNYVSLKFTFSLNSERALFSQVWN